MGKRESTNDKILKMFKNGMSVEDISREVGIPKSNIDGIIRKRMPDMDTYVPPEPGKRSILSALNTPLGELIPKRDKADKKAKKGETPPDDPHNLPTIFNLTMGEGGFTDRQTVSVAKMLKSGRSVKEVAEFFNCAESDVKAVYWNLDEHYELYLAYEEEQEQLRREKAAQEAEEEAKRAEEEASKGRKNSYDRMLTGLEDEPHLKLFANPAQLDSSTEIASIPRRRQLRIVKESVPVEHAETKEEKVVESEQPTELETKEEKAVESEQSTELEVTEDTVESIQSVEDTEEVTTDEPLHEVREDSVSNNKSALGATSAEMKMVEFAKAQLATTVESINKLKNDLSVREKKIAILKENKAMLSENLKNKITALEALQSEINKLKEEYANTSKHVSDACILYDSIAEKLSGLEAEQGQFQSFIANKAI